MSDDSDSAGLALERLNEVQVQAPNLVRLDSNSLDDILTALPFRSEEESWWDEFTNWLKSKLSQDESGGWELVRPLIEALSNWLTEYGAWIEFFVYTVLALFACYALFLVSRQIVAAKIRLPWAVKLVDPVARLLNEDDTRYWNRYLGRERLFKLYGHFLQVLEQRGLVNSVESKTNKQLQSALAKRAEKLGAAFERLYPPLELDVYGGQPIDDENEVIDGLRVLLDEVKRHE